MKSGWEKDFTKLEQQSFDGDLCRVIDPKLIRESLEKASRDELISIIEFLLPLVDEVKGLREKIEKLEKKNSRNSSLPPSRDKQKDKAKRKTRSLRKKSRRKKGGQPGHKGTTLKMSEQVDEVIDYGVDQCSHCKAQIGCLQGELVERKQVLDIPPVKLNVVEHRRYKKCCDQCGKWSTSQYEQCLLDGPPVRYGDYLKNQIVYLSIRQFIPYKRIAEMLEIMYGCKISEGTIDNMIKQKADQCMDTYTKIIESIQDSKAIGVDESGCSVEGSKHWAWTWVTPLYSLIYISDNRGYQTSELLFPNGFERGVLNSDCWKTHLKTVAKNHQVCLAHLRRECQGLIEFHQSSWARRLDKVFQDIFHVCTLPRIPSEKKREIEQRLDRLLDCHLSKSHKSIKSLKNRLVRLRDCITVCLYNRKVPADNNASERAIRMIKLKSKISGTFRSKSGAHRFAVLRTIVDSSIKQGVNPFIALQNPQILLFSS